MTSHNLTTVITAIDHKVDCIRTALETRLDGIAMGGEVHSSNIEQKTGKKWLDGKDIYQRTIIGTIPAAANTNHQISGDMGGDSYIDILIDLRGTVLDPQSQIDSADGRVNIQGGRPLGYYESPANYVVGSVGSAGEMIVRHAGYGNRRIRAVMQYTKVYAPPPLPPDEVGHWQFDRTSPETAKITFNRTDVWEHQYDMNLNILIEGQETPFDAWLYGVGIHNPHHAVELEVGILEIQVSGEESDQMEMTMTSSGSFDLSEIDISVQTIRFHVNEP